MAARPPHPSLLRRATSACSLAASEYSCSCCAAEAAAAAVAAAASSPARASAASRALAASRCAAACRERSEKVPRRGPAVPPPLRCAAAASRCSALASWKSSSRAAYGACRGRVGDAAWTCRPGRPIAIRLRRRRDAAQPLRLPLDRSHRRRLGLLARRQLRLRRVGTLGLRINSLINY